MNLANRDFSQTLLVLLAALLMQAGVLLADSRAPLAAETASDPRGLPELVICSQNLGNFGSLDDMQRRDPDLRENDYERKLSALVSRFASVNCDLIAVQELLGRSEEVGLRALNQLATALRSKTNRIFEGVVGPSNDPASRVGFLFAKDRGELLNRVSYYRVELAPLTDNEKPRYFARGPLEVQLKIKSRDGGSAKLVNVITFHFKSKYSAFKDPASVEWESWRLQMAESLRRVVEERHAAALKEGGSLLVLLGDRNSNFDAASAKVLEGTLRLVDFQGEAPCRVSARGLPLCHPGKARPALLGSLLTTDRESRKGPGTFLYRKVYSWLDDILVPQATARAAWASYDREGDYNSGVVRKPPEASDHFMIYSVFNW